MKSGRLVIHILTTYAHVFVLTLGKFKQFLSFPTHSKFTNFSCPWVGNRLVQKIVLINKILMSFVECL